MAYDEELAQRVRSHLESTPGVVEKKMFGGIAFMVHGNMACGVNGKSLIVRVGPEQYEAALARPYVRPFDMTGRPMKGWIVVDPEAHGTGGELGHWIERGVAFSQSLPAK